MRRREPSRLVLSTMTVAVGLGCLALGPEQPGPRPAFGAQGQYLSPLGLALSPSGQWLYVTEHTADRLAIVSTASGNVEKELRTPSKPAMVVVSPDGARMYVSCAEADKVAVVEMKSGRVADEIQVGAHPWGMALSADGATLYVCNRFTHDVSVVDTKSLQETARIPAVREPAFCALSPATSTLVVGNLLPLDSNYSTNLAVDVTFIDTTTNQVTKTLRLPTGCHFANQVCVSPDGQWAYLVSLLGRFLVPTTQIQRGWINTNALSVINLQTKELLATVLIDDLDLGAPNPYGAVLTPDGQKLYISLRGSHEIMEIDVPGLHRIVEQTPPEERPDLANDLTFLYRNGVKKRFKTQGKGPSGIALAAEPGELYVAQYYSDTVDIIDTGKGKLDRTIALGPAPEMDQVRLGELYFHDATLCFQHWQSCTSCHPDTRADGLMWDLMNDGMGNPKNTKSMLLTPKTPPSMSTGVRELPIHAVEAGIRFILFRQPDPDTVNAIYAYLESLEPVPGPIHRAGKEAQESIKRGKELFEDEKRTGCSKCHPASLYTDLKTYDVGTEHEYDRRADYDTPTLIECYRTAPYLHSGTAVTLRDVLTDNPGDKHGRTSDLTEQEINDLVAFMESL